MTHLIRLFNGLMLVALVLIGIQAMVLFAFHPALIALGVLGMSYGLGLVVA